MRNSGRYLGFKKKCLIDNNDYKKIEGKFAYKCFMVCVYFTQRRGYKIVILRSD